MTERYHCTCRANFQPGSVCVSLDTQLEELFTYPVLFLVWTVLAWRW